MVRLSFCPATSHDALNEKGESLLCKDQDDTCVVLVS